MAFSDPNDIESMRKHEGYEELKEIQHEEEIAKTDEVPHEVPHEAQVLKIVKQRGRPKNVVVPVEDVAEI